MKKNILINYYEDEDLSSFISYFVGKNITEDFLMNEKLEIKELINYLYKEIAELRVVACEIRDEETLSNFIKPFVKISNFVTFFKEYIYIMTDMYMELFKKDIEAVKINLYYIKNAIGNCSDLLDTNEVFNSVKTRIDFAYIQNTELFTVNKHFESIRTNFKDNNSVEAKFIESKIDYLINQTYELQYKKENRLYISQYIFKKCSKKTKDIILSNQKEINASKNIYFLVYNNQNIEAVKKEPILNKRKDANTWLINFESVRGTEGLVNQLEEVIIANNIAIKNLNQKKYGYLDYKLRKNGHINSGDKLVNFYQDFIKSFFKMVKEDGFICDNIADLSDSFLKENIKNRKMAEKELGKHFPIPQSLTKIFDILQQELNITYECLNEFITTKKRILIFKITKSKRIGFIKFEFSKANNSEFELLSPYLSEHTNIPLLFDIRISVDEEEVKTGFIHPQNFTDLCHEIGHMMHFFFSENKSLDLVKMDELELPALFMEKYFLQDSVLQKITSKEITQEQIKLIQRISKLDWRMYFLSEMKTNVITNFLLEFVKKEGDLIEGLQKIKLIFKEAGIKWNDKIFFEGEHILSSFQFEKNRFDYTVNHFSYFLANIVGTNLVKNKVSMKKSFTNIFYCDMIKTDQCYWSKYVNFNQIVFNNFM